MYRELLECNDYGYSVNGYRRDFLEHLEQLEMTGEIVGTATSIVTGEVHMGSATTNWDAVRKEDEKQRGRLAAKLAPWIKEVLDPVNQSELGRPRE
jgi:hypothetical protein